MTEHKWKITTAALYPYLLLKSDCLVGIQQSIHRTALPFIPSFRLTTFSIARTLRIWLIFKYRDNRKESNTPQCQKQGKMVIDQTGPSSCFLLLCLLLQKENWLSSDSADSDIISHSQIAKRLFSLTTAGSEAGLVWC